MKRFIISILLLMVVFVLPAQQSKRVYITLDVSGSMTGNKYVLANYTTQMIVTLLDEDDEVYMIVYGVPECLSNKKAPLSVIQKPHTNLIFGNPTSPESQFDDIIGFNKVYKESSKKQNWLFIIGDGEWWCMEPEYKNDRDKFSSIIKKGTLNICYLQTGESLNYRDSDFTKFLSSFGMADIGRSDTNPKTIMDGCNHFAEKILGFSNEQLKVNKSGSNAISFTAEIPLKGFYLVYQDALTPANLPKIDKATANGKELSVQLKGTPSTEHVRTYPNDINLSGRVYWVSGSTIPANKEIKVAFDKSIDPAKLSVYPVVAEEIAFGSKIIPKNDSQAVQRIDGNTYSICQDETKALVRVELDKEVIQNLPKDFQKKTKVVVKANNKEYATKFKDGGFECEIDLLNEETQYYAECDYSGYFKQITPITTIVKGDCEPVKPAEPEVNVHPVVNVGSFTLNQLKNDEIVFSIVDSLTNEVLDPSKFDITLDSEYSFMFHRPKVEIVGNEIKVELRPKGEWCECLLPKSLDFKLISTPKESAYETYGKQYTKSVFPFHMDLVKEGTWFSRCLWVILAIIGLLLLLLYLWALQKKRRFKKNAKIMPSYYNYYGNKLEAGSIYLRKEGFGAWFKRWFLPGDERSTLNFDKPTTSLRFVAADSQDVVLVPKDGIDPETMSISGYNPKRDQHPKEPVKLGNQGKINVKKSDGNDDGFLTFSSGDATDGTGARIFMGILMAASILALLFMVYLVIKSLI